MAEKKAKPKAGLTSRASGRRKTAAVSKQTRGSVKAGTKANSLAAEAKPVKRIAGGNRQIGKADGDAPLAAIVKGHPIAARKRASSLVDEQKRTLGDWREETLSRMRELILEAAPEIIEERKWRKPSNGMAGVPVWSHNGIICTGETYSKVVKLTFAQGAKIADPSRLFNSSLEGNTRRAIDIREGEQINAGAFKKLVKAAVALNGSSANKVKSGAKAANPNKANKATKPQKGEIDDVVLLSGGNPQIAKADGEAPVQAYIAAMPGWKQVVGRWLDSIIVRNVPDVRKAVKWNTPFYGVEGQGWFLGFHCITKYIKVAFFRGTSLDPMPPGESTQKDVRYFHIHEGDPLDEALMATWLKQAAALPGWNP